MPNLPVPLNMPMPPDAATLAAAMLRRIANDPELLTAAHLAIENYLIMMRDAHMFTGPHANGFVVREKDGDPSEIIRMGTRAGIVMALKAIADQLDTN